MSDAVLPTPSRPVLRPWRAPVIAELPKLTALTLASAIGGGGGTSGGGSTVFGLLLALSVAFGAGACSNDRTLSGEPGEGPAPVGQLVTCSVDRTELTLRCDSPQSAPGTVVLGGQGTRVALRSSGVSYSIGTGILSANVTVQNISAGPLATLDGVTPSLEGIRVFFVSGPDALPTGAVTVNNPTGVATFTAGSQAYYEYSGMLASGATSGSLPWEFHFTGGATSFTFGVMISTDVPALSAIRRWTEEPGLNTINWDGIAGWGSDGLAVIGQYGEVYIRDGGAWYARNYPVSQSAYGPLVAAGPNDITYFYNNGSSTHHWDGISWRAIEGLPGGPGNGGLVSRVGNSGKTGACAFGFWQKCFDGSVWTDIAVTGTPNVAASTVIGGNVVVLTTLGHVWSRDSTSGVWTEVGAPGSLQTQGPGAIFGTDTSHIWTISLANNTDPVIRYYHSGSWSSPAVPSGQENNTGYPVGGVAFGSDDAYIIRNDNLGHGYVWHFDGADWTVVRSSPTQYTGIWARGYDDFYLSGYGGIVEHFDDGDWSQVLNSPGAARSVSMLSATDGYVGTQNGRVLRYNGAEWAEVANFPGTVSSLYAADGSDLMAATGQPYVYYWNGGAWGGIDPGTGWSTYGVGGSSRNNIWLVGALSQIYRYDADVGGTLVSAVGVLGFADLYAVWALNANFAVAVGQSGAIFMWNGTSWTAPLTLPTGNALRAVSGVSTSNVWAVGDGGVIVHYDGTSWSTMSSGTGQDLKGVWAKSLDEVYAVGAGKTVLAYNGTAWTAPTIQSSFPSSTFYGVSGAGSQILVAGDRALRGFH